MAVHLARHPDKLRSLRNKIMHTRETCALFDTERYVRNLEQVYNTVFESNCKTPTM